MSSPSGSAYTTTAFLQSIYPPWFFSPDAGVPSRPFVTLTYAQSLDGKISGPGGAQIILSGQHSMALTHRLRELHDSILVGVGTMLSDNPSLTARIPTLLPLPSQPQPLVLDANLRTPPTVKVIQNGISGISHPPVILTSPVDPGDRRRTILKAALTGAGSNVVECEVTEKGHISLDSVLKQPKVGKSLMVEGGASVISSFLASGLVDLVVITIAPTLIGDGVSMVKEGVVPPALEHVATKSFGQDVVIVCKPSVRRT